MLLLANGRSSDLSSLTRSSRTSAKLWCFAIQWHYRSAQKGFTASGNVADSHCVPILAPYPHGIIHKGENQMRLQSYMFFWKRQNRKRKTAVNLLFLIKFIHYLLSNYFLSYKYAASSPCRSWYREPRCHGNRHCLSLLFIILFHAIRHISLRTNPQMIFMND